MRSGTGITCSKRREASERSCEVHRLTLADANGEHPGEGVGSGNNPTCPQCVWQHLTGENLNE